MSIFLASLFLIENQRPLKKYKKNRKAGLKSFGEKLYILLLTERLQSEIWHVVDERFLSILFKKLG